MVIELQSEKKIFFKISDLSKGLRNFANKFSETISYLIEQTGCLRLSTVVEKNIASFPCNLLFANPCLGEEKDLNCRKSAEPVNRLNFFAKKPGSDSLQRAKHRLATLSFSVSKVNYPQNWKTIFVHLYRKINLLVRLENNTGFSC